MVWFIEGDTDTGPSDLAGPTGNSQGDWITGIDYPIIDYPNYAPVTHFLQPGTNTISYPTFVMICPNRKVILSEAGYSASWNEAFFVGKMGTCPTSGTGIEEAINSTSFNVSPNPATTTLNVNVEVLAKTKATLAITNILGQVVSRQELSLQAGNHNQSLDISALPAGLYVLSVTTDKGTLQHKFIKE